MPIIRSYDRGGVQVHESAQLRSSEWLTTRRSQLHKEWSTEWRSSTWSVSSKEQCTKCATKCKQKCSLRSLYCDRGGVRDSVRSQMRLKSTRKRESDRGALGTSEVQKGYVAITVVITKKPQQERRDASVHSSARHQQRCKGTTTWCTWRTLKYFAYWWRK